MNKTAFAILIIASTAGGLCQAGSNKPHWGYTGHEGPEHWDQLDASYATCATGRNQSPIDLTGFVEAELEPLGFDYRSKAKNIINNGHSVQANFSPGSSLSVGGHRFELQQVHFHAPSENHIDGRSYAMEAHFVHADADGALAVVAVMFEPGADNAALANLWAEMPEKPGQTSTLTRKISGEALMPESRAYYRFNGSLTTPPCSEGVWWLVMKDSITASKNQIDRFSRVMQRPNNRPIQPINGRVVLK